MSFFEATWALAAWYFAQQSVDLVIWEIGLGGRLDACNVCEPIASGITSIALDHMHVLGNTLEEIATEKSAIYRVGSPAFTSAHGDGLKALQTVSPYPLHICDILPTNLVTKELYPHQKRNLSYANSKSHSSQWVGLIISKIFYFSIWIVVPIFVFNILLNFQFFN